MKHVHAEMRIADNPNTESRCFQNYENQLDSARQYLTPLIQEELRHWQNHGIDDHGLGAEDAFNIMEEFESAIRHVNTFDAIHTERDSVTVNVDTSRLMYTFEITNVDKVCS